VEESQARLEELQALQRDLTFAAHRARVGSRARVLVEGASRRGGGEAGSAALQGRDPYHRVVNFRAPLESAPTPGSFSELSIVEATPHSLIGSLEEAPSFSSRARRALESIGPQPAA